MTDSRTSGLAEILVNYATRVKAGEWVIVSGNVVALPLIAEVVEKIFIAGGNPNVLLMDGLLVETKFRFASEEQLKWVSPIVELVNSQADVMIQIGASSNTRALSGTDPKKHQTVAAAHREITRMFTERSAAKELRWTLANYPCPAFAQDAEMSLRDYEDFVYKATFADQDDSVGAWQRLFDEQQRIVDWLVGKKRVEVRGPNVDLSLSIAGRTFINGADGQNVPGGEIFTSPVEDSANGWIKFTYPAITGGREVAGIELEFEDGRVVSARAVKNEEFLLSTLDTDEGARYLGEFAIGTNYGITRFTKNILYDEKLGGTMHLAIGNGFPETGAKNRSAIHWDMICDMRQNGEIRIDGELFYKDGQFQV